MLNVRKWITILIFMLTGGMLFPAEITPPEEFIGYPVGADFHYTPYDSILLYLQKVENESERVVIENLGTSTLGNPMVLVIISSEENIKNLDRLKEQQRKIADPRLINSQSEEEELIKDSKPFVWLNCQLHSTESASSQMAMELAYELASSQDPGIVAMLDQCVILLMPCANPDGQLMVNDYYKRSLGTPWEGGYLPYLYHHYAGHDNNRDWFMLNLQETRVITKALYSEWFPTVLWDIHQSGKYSYRLFLPPFHDPKNPNVHPIIERMLYVLGGQMAAALSAEGKRGVIHGVSYDNYWAGGFRTTPHRHNILGVLSEAASVNIASPLFIRKSELKGTRRGMTTYEMSVKFPDPWPGGWWRLRDIIDYEKSAAYALLDYVRRYHDLLQKNYLQMGKDAILAGKEEPPYAWLIPPGQKDPGRSYELLWRLHLAGVEIHQSRKPFQADGIQYPAGTFILYAAQPYRPYLKDMMEKQEYPNRSICPGGPAEPPYDMAGWTFPLMMGVKAVTVASSFDCDTKKLNTIPFPQGKIDSRKGKEYFRFPAGVNHSYTLIYRAWKKGIPVYLYKYPPESGNPNKPESQFVIKTNPEQLKGLIKGLTVSPCGINLKKSEKNNLIRLKPLRIGLYQPWTANIDEGWLRYIFDNYEVPYQTLHNPVIKAGNLKELVDVIVLPSQRVKSIIEGWKKDTTFPEYTGGIGEEGIINLQDFVTDGGVLICCDGATNLVLEYFNIPVINPLRKEKTDFYCPGSILQVFLDTQYLGSLGMGELTSVCFTNSQVFELLKKGDSAGNQKKEFLPFYHDVKVIARYSDGVILQSGWIRGEEKIKGKPALVEIGYGKGYIELIGFRVEQRAQTQGTFPILFNLLLRPTVPGKN